MRKITVDQSHQIMSTLVANVDWSTIDFEVSKLQDNIIRNPKEAGRQFTAFLKNGGKVIVGESPKIVIDRTELLKEIEINGNIWKVVENDTDTQSTSLTEIDLLKIRIEMTDLKDGEEEDGINGEEELKRLKEKGVIRLDAMVLQALIENPSVIPENWKKNKSPFIYFYGTIFQDLLGETRGVLFMYWDINEQKWQFNMNYLYNYLGYCDKFAVLL